MNNKSLFVHKANNKLQFCACDSHGCLTMKARTLPSAVIWEEYDAQEFKRIPEYGVHYDMLPFDDYFCVRAYKDPNSGVLIVETGLWESNESKCAVLALHKSAFTQYEGKAPVSAIRDEKYDLVAIRDFQLMGLDDDALIAHNLIGIPKGTKFEIVPEPFDIPNGYHRPMPEWPMVALRNAAIGLEIMIASRCMADLFEYIDPARGPVKDTGNYPYQVRCWCCNAPIPSPIPAGEESEKLERANDMWLLTELHVGRWLCNRCHQEHLHTPRHTWFYQTQEHPSAYVDGKFWRD